MDKLVPGRLPCLCQVVTAEHQPALPRAAPALALLCPFISTFIAFITTFIAVISTFIAFIQWLLLPGIAPGLGKGQCWMLASRASQQNTSRSSTLGTNTHQNEGKEFSCSFWALEKNRERLE